MIAGFVFCAAMLFVPLQSGAEEGTAVSKSEMPISYEEGGTLSKDGVQISYSVYGEGEPVLVFVHGWCSNRSVWEKQVPYFQENYRVVTLDLAGHGASGKERSVYSLEAFGQDVAAVVRKIEAENVILIGHSMGGPVVMAAAEIIPDRVIAVVGIDTLQDFDEHYSAAQVEEIVRPFKEDFKKALDPFLRSMFVQGTDPKLIDEIFAMMSGASAQVGISALEEMFGASYIDNPPQIDVPVWALNADLWPTKPEVNRKYVPEFNLRIMPGLGHFLMMESPDAFNQELESIIKQIVETHTLEASL